MDIVDSLIGLIGGLAGATIAYFVNRRQQSANTANIETNTRIAEGAAEVANARQAVEIRLAEIEANQAGLAYYKDLVTDMQVRTKERDAERDIEQATLRGQVVAIESVQAEAKNLHDSHITELLTSIAGMVASLGEADAKIVVLQGQIDELQLKVEGSNAIIAGMQAEMLKDKDVISSLREQIQTLLVQSVDKAEAKSEALTKALE